MERDQITGVLEDVGAVVLANACGPCPLGRYIAACCIKCVTVFTYSSRQWKREDTKEGANGGLYFAS